MLALLTLDGVLSAVGGALFLPSYVGSVPLPVSALVSGLLNASLVWAALQWTSVTWVAALPLVAFLVTSVGLTFGGRGGDIVFGGAGVLAFSSLYFVAIGAVPPALVLRRHLGPTP